MKTIHTQSNKSAKGGAGFTLHETMVSMFLFSMVIAGFYMAFSRSILQTRAGSSQARFVGTARSVQQQVSKYVMSGKAIVVMGDYLYIMTTNNRYASVAFRDLDGNPTTMTNNVIVYDPDIWVGGDEVYLCDYVSRIDGENIFSNLPFSPASVKMTFHIGDYTNAASADYYGTGHGYQGVEVRFSAAPRNLQYWYQ